MQVLISSTRPAATLFTHSESAKNGRAMDTISTMPLAIRLSASSGILMRLLAITGTPTGGEDDESAMRSQGGSEPTKESADESLIEAGEAASTNGAKALVSWWGALTQKQRDQLSTHFLAWKKAAAKFDQDQKGKP